MTQWEAERKAEKRVQSFISVNLNGLLLADALNIIADHFEALTKTVRDLESKDGKTEKN